jgi:hypothetical protein
LSKAQSRKLVKSETLELGENMSLSSVQQSEKEVTTVTGGVQNATRNKFINVTILCLPLILNGNLEYCLLARFDSQKSINLPFSIKDTCFAS